MDPQGRISSKRTRPAICPEEENNDDSFCIKIVVVVNIEVNIVQSSPPDFPKRNERAVFLCRDGRCRDAEIIIVQSYNN